MSSKHKSPPNVGVETGGGYHLDWTRPISPGASHGAFSSADSPLREA